MGLEFNWSDDSSGAYKQVFARVDISNAVEGETNTSMCLRAGKSARNALYFFSIAIGAVLVKRRYGFKSTEDAKRAGEISAARLYRLLSE